MKRIIALDQASRVTGYAVFDNKNLVTFGHFSIPANKTMGKRLSSFIDHIDNLITSYHPEKIYFEGIQYQSNIETYKKLAMIQGVLIYALVEGKIEATELTPSHGRSIIKEKHKINFGRSRTEQKKQSQEFVRQHFGEDVTEDEADAICLGYAGILEDEKTKSPF